MIYEIASDGAPRYIAVDLSTGRDMTVEVEWEYRPDGTIVVLDFREIEPRDDPSTET